MLVGTGTETNKLQESHDHLRQEWGGMSGGRTLFSSVHTGIGIPEGQKGGLKILNQDINN